MRKLAISLLLLFLLPAASFAEGTCEPDEPNFDELDLGRLGFQLIESRDVVIRNELRWCRFWAKAHAGLADPPPCDETLVDFERETVVASWIGTRGAGCYAARISRVEPVLGSRAVTVTVTETVPGRSCLCSPSFVSPLAVAVIPAKVGRVEFVHEQDESDCPGL